MRETKPPLKRDMHWPTVLVYIHLHIFGLYGLYLLFVEAKWLTVIFVSVITLIAGLGITIGAHRLWAHRSYTAAFPLRLFLVIAHTLAGVGNIHDWVLAHRIHHKFYGTDFDPYNHNKGFIYSHIISNLITTHPEQENIAKAIDMFDIERDGLVYIQKKLYWILMPIVAILLPMNAPAEYWGESISNSTFILGFLRIAISINMAWLVNSGNSIWGLKPGEKYPADDNSIFLITKSYWPHYHYAVPWDYKTGEFGTYESGCSTVFIKIFEVLGLATCLKTATSEQIREALAKVATKGIKLEASLRDVQAVAEEEAIRTQLAVKH